MKKKKSENENQGIMIEIMAVCMLGIVLSLGVLLVAVSKVILTSKLKLYFLFFLTALKRVTTLYNEFHG